MKNLSESACTNTYILPDSVTTENITINLCNGLHKLNWPNSGEEEIKPYALKASWKRNPIQQRIMKTKDIFSLTIPPLIPPEDIKFLFMVISPSCYSAEIPRAAFLSASPIFWNKNRKWNPEYLFFATNFYLKNQFSGNDRPGYLSSITLWHFVRSFAEGGLLHFYRVAYSLPLWWSSVSEF